MKRSLYLILLNVALVLPAQAFDWPWQGEQDVRYGYCRGFVMAGLAEEELSERARIDLWLTWNYIVRAEFAAGAFQDEDFQQGRDQLDSLVASGNFQGIRDIANSDCYLGRNRRSGDDA